MGKKIIIDVFSKKTGKDAVLCAELMSSDLMIVYADPISFLSMLSLYAKYVDLRLPPKAWFISEYNGANAEYQAAIQKMIAHPVPANVQLKIMMTGFPDKTLPIPSIGVFADPQESRGLTENEKKLLKNLGYESASVKPNLFFGYTNYSNNIEGIGTYNSKINLEFFIYVAVKQYLAFNNVAHQKNTKIDIISPFNKKQYQRIIENMRSKMPNIKIEIVSIVKEGCLQIESISDGQPGEKIIVVRLMNLFPLTPALFKYFLEISQALTIQTGDHSFMEAILNNKVPLLYQVMSWKANYYLKFIDFMSKINDDLLSSVILKGDAKLSAEYVAFHDTIYHFILSALGTLDYGLDNNVPEKNITINAHLQKLIEIATHPELFQHTVTFFKMLSQEIIKHMNAADELRTVFKKTFPILEWKTNEESKKERKFVKELKKEPSYNHALLTLQRLATNSENFPMTSFAANLTTRTFSPVRTVVTPASTVSEKKIKKIT